MYVRDGVYYYRNGWNTPAVVATLAGTAVALGGAFWAPMAAIYDWSWFIGFGLAGGLYYAMMRGAAPPTRVPEARIERS